MFLDHALTSCAIILVGLDRLRGALLVGPDVVSDESRPTNSFTIDHLNEDTMKLHTWMI